MCFFIFNACNTFLWHKRWTNFSIFVHLYHYIFILGCILIFWDVRVSGVSRHTVTRAHTHTNIKQIIYWEFCICKSFCILEGHFLQCSTPENQKNPPLGPTMVGPRGDSSRNWYWYGTTSSSDSEEGAGGIGPLKTWLTQVWPSLQKWISSPNYSNRKEKEPAPLIFRFMIKKTTWSVPPYCNIVI